MTTSKSADEDLTAAVASAVRQHPDYDTAEVIAAAAKSLIRLPEWTAVSGPAQRRAWPTYLNYRSPDGVHSVSFDRSWMATEVREARQALTRRWGPI